MINVVWWYTYKQYLQCWLLRVFKTNVKITYKERNKESEKERGVLTQTGIEKRKISMGRGRGEMVCNEVWV